MNCRNCAAPLELTPFQEQADCVHCGTSHEMRALEDGFDRVVWSEELSGTSCPRCAEGLVRAALENHSVEACRTCRGVMLTNAAFGAIVRKRRAGYRGSEFTPHPVDLESLTDPVHCPGCRRTMEVHPYYGPGHQIIDSCVRCGLVWIDAGELTAIERAPGLR